jgi:hypothetical protein
MTHYKLRSCLHETDKWYTNNNQIRTRDNSRKIPISMATDRSHYVTISSLPHVLLHVMWHVLFKKKSKSQVHLQLLIQQSLADGSSASRGFQGCRLFSISTYFEQQRICFYASTTFTLRTNGSTAAQFLRHCYKPEGRGLIPNGVFWDFSLP